MDTRDIKAMAPKESQYVCPGDKSHRTFRRFWLARFEEQVTLGEERNVRKKLGERHALAKVMCEVCGAVAYEREGVCEAMLSDPETRPLIKENTKVAGEGFIPRYGYGRHKEDPNE